MYWPACPCGCGKDHSGRGASAYLRGDPKTGKGGSRGRLSGQFCPGAGEGDHHFFQAGPSVLEGDGYHASGYAGTCGFQRGDGADAAGSGLCGSCDQRIGRSSGACGDPVEAFKAVPDPCFSFCEQNGPAWNEPGKPAGGTAGETGRRMPDFRSRCRKGRGCLLGRACPVQRGPDGGISGDRGSAGEVSGLRHKGEAAVSLLLWFCPETERSGGTVGGAEAFLSVYGVSAGIWRQGVQDFQG